jgi:hypothetical protein
MRMMEHRLGRRLPVSIAARLRFSDGTLGWGRVTNISRDGLFVESSVRPRHGVGCIDVRMTLPGPGGPSTHLVPGLVMHQAKGGYGLMFRELGHQAREAILCLLKSDTPQFDRSRSSHSATSRTPVANKG